MMRDHVMHKANVVWRVARFGDLDGLVGAEFLRWLARGAGLDDRRLGRAYGRQQERPETGATRQANRVSSHGIRS